MPLFNGVKFLLLPLSFVLRLAGLWCCDDADAAPRGSVELIATGASVPFTGALASRFARSPCDSPASFCCSRHSSSTATRTLCGRSTNRCSVRLRGTNSLNRSILSIRKKQWFHKATTRTNNNHSSSNSLYCASLSTQKLGLGMREADYNKQETEGLLHAFHLGQTRGHGAQTHSSCAVDSSCPIICTGELSHEARKEVRLPSRAVSVRSSGVRS